MTHSRVVTLEDGTRLTITGMEIEQLEAMFDDGFGVPLQTIAEGVTFGPQHQHLSVRILRMLIEGAFVRAVIGYHPVQITERSGLSLDAFFDQHSLDLDETVPLVRSHDWSHRLGHLVSHRHVDGGIDLEFYIPAPDVPTVADLTPCGLSPSLLANPTKDRWITRSGQLRRHNPVIEFSLTPHPVLPSWATLHDRSRGHDELVDAQVEALERRHGWSPLDARLARLRQRGIIAA